MKCPHCLVQINANVKEISLGYDSEFYWRAFVSLCPNPDCKKLIIDLGKGNVSQDENGNYLLHNIISKQTVYPQTSGRLAAPLEVEEQYAGIYKEACLVLPFSPQAAAALGRKCLQLILRDKADIKPSNLSKEIDEVATIQTMPPSLVESIVEIKNLGNFKIYPSKSLSTGEVVDATPEEAEWILDVLESLFDFYFVQPAKLMAKREALNKKLSDLANGDNATNGC